MQFQKRAALAAPLLIATSASALAQQVSGNAFNPAVSLILDGHFASYSQDPKTYQLPGFLLDPEGGLGAEGLSLDETELAVSANVDDKYYGSMLNTQLSDTGVQLSWVVPTDLYMQIGGEWLRGDAFPAANGAESHGTGSATFFFHVGGDVGATSSWRAGLSYLKADANDRISEFSSGTTSFTGTSDLAIADFVWKW